MKKVISDEVSLHGTFYHKKLLFWSVDLNGILKVETPFAVIFTMDNCKDKSKEEIERKIEDVLFEIDF